MKKYFDYVGLLVRYETLKRNDKKNLRKLERLETENQTLRQCLSNEEKRTETFRKAYRESLNNYEVLTNDYQKLDKQNKSLERKIKKLEKEIEK